MKEDKKETCEYADIMHLSHHVSCKHKPMAILDRAAQFAPFAALSGYDGAIMETARLTDRRIELDEEEKSILDQKIRRIQEQIDAKQVVELTYFQPDETKVGGKYIIAKNSIKKINEYERIIIMQDGCRIQMEEIIDIKRILEDNRQD